MPMTLHPIVDEIRQFARKFYGSQPFSYLLQRAIIMNAAPASKYISYNRLAKFLHSAPGTPFRSLLFKNFCAGESLEDAIVFHEKYSQEGVMTMLDRIGESSTSDSNTESMSLDDILPDIKKDHCLGLSVSIKLSAYFKPEDLLQISNNLCNGAEISDQIDRHGLRPKYASLMSRLDSVTKLYPVAIDAESSDIQPAISSIANLFMRELNVNNVRVFNTYQAYLRGSYPNLIRDMAIAKQNNFTVGIKLVRGAYLSYERTKQPSLVFDTIEETHKNYDLMFEHAFKNGCHPNAIIVASHNENSVAKALEFSDRHGGDSVSFAQLFGMRDYLTNFLVDKRQRAFKYVPYGRQNLAIPYLIRRSEENSSVLEGLAFEKHLITRELFKYTIPFGRRIF